MQVESFKIKGWKEIEVGLVIAENEDWILVKHIPVDYLVDGYRLYQKKFVKRRESATIEKRVATVLSLKKVTEDIPENFNFSGVIETLQWCESTYGLFEFQTKDQDDIFYGKLAETHANQFSLNMITPDGEMDSDNGFTFIATKVRAISFETDYFESIKLLMLNQGE